MVNYQINDPRADAKVFTRRGLCPKLDHKNEGKS